MSDVEQTVERQVRTCDECGQEDDHPHHLMYGVVQFTDPVTGKLVMDDRSVSRHLDCCNCGHCLIVLGTADGKKGAELVSHITSKPAQLHTQLRAAGYDVED